MTDVNLGDEAAGDEPAVTYEWKRWAALSILRGTPLAAAISTMVDEGIPEEDAAATLAEVMADPIFEAGRWTMQQLSKLESVLSMRQQMRALGDVPATVDRRSGLTREDFLNEYYSLNKPVIIEDACHDWPALTRWTPEYLVDALGGAEVEVMGDRDSDDSYEINANQRRIQMPFDEYVAKVTATEWSNDLYLVANNKLLESDVSDPLWKDFELDGRYLALDAQHKLTFFWFGPAGTVTKLHHDLMNVFFHQVQGWKHFILISPLETHCVSNSIGVYSDLDPKMPDLTRFPRYAQVQPFHLNVGPGEALFVPVGWWHHVEALEMSISVSTTSFAFDNTVPWSNPTKIL